MIGSERPDGWSNLQVAHVDLGETAVEEDLRRVEFELEAELLIVDELVAAEVEECGGKVVEGSVVAGEEEVGDTTLEIPGKEGGSVSDRRSDGLEQKGGDRKSGEGGRCRVRADRRGGIGSHGKCARTFARETETIGET